MNIKRILLSAVLSAGVLLSAAGCSLFGQGGSSSGNVGDITFADGDKIAVIEIKDYGTVKAKLFPDIAPIGVQNFIQLAESGYYNGLKIHRVLKDQLIQGGSLNGDGTGGTAAYTGIDEKKQVSTGTFPIEVSEKARNFYGALGYAADEYGENAVQFYIVANKTPQDITKIDKAKVKAKADEIAAEIAGSTAEAESTEKETASYQQSYLTNNANMLSAKNNADAAKKYSEVGGLYQIDGGYTVFGQIFEGLDVIDQISGVEVGTGATGEKSMPIQDIIISSVTIETYKVSTAEATAEASKNSSAPTSSAPAASVPESSASDAESSVPEAVTMESSAPDNAATAENSAAAPSTAESANNAASTSESTPQGTSENTLQSSNEQLSTVDTNEAA